MGGLQPGLKDGGQVIVPVLLEFTDSDIEDITRRREDMTFYLRVVKTIFYERAQRVSEILFLPREDTSHIFKPPCNVLFII